MKTITIISRGSLALALVAAAAAAGCTEQGDVKAAATESPVPAVANAHLEWAGSWKAAQQEAKARHKPILVTFYADWCIWCKKLDQTTLSDSRVASFLDKATIPVRLDVDGDGRELSDQYHVDGLPTVLLIDADGTEIGRIPGYLPPDGFLDRLESFVTPEDQPSV